MALTKYKLGDLICEITRKNDDLKYGIEYVRGVSNTKEIMPTKADVDPNIINKFYVIMPNEFIYNPRTTRMGDKVGLAYNDTSTPLLFTFNNIAFAIKETAKTLILPDYLYIYFNRSEFDRYAIVNSWESATELFTFTEMCDIDIELPSIEIQQKYVAVYKAMIANQKSYERGLEDLKLVCDAYIENLRRNISSEPIGKYIVRKNDKNTDQKTNNVMGLSTQKQFREAQSRVNKNDLSKYKVVLPNEFAFVPTTDTWKVLAFGLNSLEEPIVVSPIYEVFAVKNDFLEPRYLAMWLSRIEFDRYARYNSWGSARENFSFEEMCNVHIPIPNIDIQRSISDVFSLYKKRRDINEQLKTQIKNICPILIKGSLEEGK